MTEESREKPVADSKFAQYIPDRIRLRDARGRLVMVYNPSWWRLDRHVFWAVKRALAFLFGGGRTGTASFSAVTENKDGTKKVENFELPVYEIPDE